MASIVGGAVSLDPQSDDEMEVIQEAVDAMTPSQVKQLMELSNFPQNQYHDASLCTRQSPSFTNDS